MNHKSFPSLPVLVFFLLFQFPIKQSAKELPLLQNLPREKGFALVELFTSEASATSPAADKLVNLLEQEADKENTEIYFLNMHVNYWDYLGWTDIYGNKLFMDRQDYYAAYFPSARTYTPQMVLNGAIDFIGSDEQRARKEIAAALKQKKETLFSSVKATKRDSTIIEIKYELTRMPDDCSLYFALVEKNLPPSDIKSGENKGIKLAHQSVTRLLERTESRSLIGTHKFIYKTKKNSSNYSVITFVQQNEKRTIEAVYKTMVK